MLLSSSKAFAPSLWFGTAAPYGFVWNSTYCKDPPQMVITLLHWMLADTNQWYVKINIWLNYQVGVTERNVVSSCSTWSSVSIELHFRCNVCAGEGQRCSKGAVVTHFEMEWKGRNVQESGAELDMDEIKVTEVSSGAGLTERGSRWRWDSLEG